MPGSQVRLLNLILRTTTLIRHLETERKILLTIQVLIIRDILLVDTVLVTVNPVVPDDIILQLFLKASTELVYKLSVSDPVSPVSILLSIFSASRTGASLMTSS